MICGGTLLAVDDRPQNPHDWEQWLVTTRQTINTIATRAPGTPTWRNPVSYTPHVAATAAWHSATPTSQQGLLEPGAVKAARLVLRGAGHSDVRRLTPTRGGALTLGSCFTSERKPADAGRAVAAGSERGPRVCRTRVYWCRGSA